MKELIAILIICASYSHALYDGKRDVVDLTSSNFDKLVTKSDDIWIVEFYAPWCGHCKQFAPEYAKAATALKGIVKVGAVDADNNKDLGSRFGISGFPTVKIFGNDKNKPESYNGARTADGLTQVALKQLQNIVNIRLGKKSSGSSGGSGFNNSPKSEPGGGRDVVKLADSDIVKNVLNSEQSWLVEFYAPWCGHCKSLAPVWADVASKLKGKVNVGAVDATQDQTWASKLGVRGYPTIKFFPAGSKSERDAVDYDGPRDASSIEQWAVEKSAASIKPPEVYEITDDKVFKENCVDKKICIISFLPHLLDCQSECRNSHIKMMRKLGDKYKKQGWGWVWVEGATQPKLEESVGVGGFGYPAMVALSSSKLVYAPHKGSFSMEGVNDFLLENSFGRGSTLPIYGSKLPVIEKTKKWDGKDAEMPVEEDLDLSDVELDDLPEEKSEL